MCIYLCYFGIMFVQELQTYFSLFLFSLRLLLRRITVIAHTVVCSFQRDYYAACPSFLSFPEVSYDRYARVAMRDGCRTADRNNSGHTRS